MHAAPHVLVVEDDVDTSELVQGTLEDAGFDVVAVHSGAEALAYLARVDVPWVVLLDLVMDDMNGWEVLSALRAATSAHHEVIVVSGMQGVPLPSGVPLLQKPFSKSQLLRIVRSVSHA